MSTKYRRLSNSGYYHLIIRGNGKQILFECNSDRTKFLSSLQKFSKENEIKVSAYCLMDNHVHILACGEQNHIAKFMKKIQLSYVRYYNNKYERTGHLFQGNYFSEPVNTDQYLLTVFRYILCNPVKAGYPSVYSYPWSSYALYDSKSTFVDTSIFHGMLGNSKNYLNFIQGGCDRKILEEGNLRYENRKHDDDWALDMIRFLFNIKSGTILQEYSRQKRDQAIALLLRKGLSHRQIERLTGISRGVIGRVSVRENAR